MGTSARASFEKAAPNAVAAKVVVRPAASVYHRQVPYRDDSEGLRLRVRDLEQDLSEARDTIARLEGRGATDVAESSEPSRFTGLARKQVLRHDLDFELTDEGYEAIAELMRQRMRATPSLVGRTLSYRWQGFEFRVLKIGENRSRVELTNDAGPLTIGVGVLAFFITFFATVPFAAVLADMGHSPVGVLVALPFVLLAAYAAALALVKRRQEKLQTGRAGFFESVIQVASKHHKPTQAPRIRVKTGEDEQAEQEALAEAQLAAKHQGL